MLFRRYRVLKRQDSVRIHVPTHASSTRLFSNNHAMDICRHPRHSVSCRRINVRDDRDWTAELCFGYAKTGECVEERVPGAFGKTPIVGGHLMEWKCLMGRDKNEAPVPQDAVHF